MEGHVLVSHTDLMFLCPDDGFSQSGYRYECLHKVFERGFRGSPKFVEAVLTFALKALDLLETLHHSGVLHGDIHVGNIVFKVPRGDDPEKYNRLADEPTLIDLGEAKYFISRKGREL